MEERADQLPCTQRAGGNGEGLLGPAIDAISAATASSRAVAAARSDGASDTFCSNSLSRSARSYKPWCDDNEYPKASLPAYKSASHRTSPWFAYDPNAAEPTKFLAFLADLWPDERTLSMSTMRGSKNPATCWRH
jgi:hypothetical protein